MLLFILCFHSLSGFIEALFQLASKVVLAVHIQFLADMAALAGDVRFTLVQFDADFLQHLTFQYHLEIILSLLVRSAHTRFQAFLLSSLFFNCSAARSRIFCCCSEI